MVIKKDVKEKEIKTKKMDEFKKHHGLGSLLKIVLILFIISVTVLAIVNIFDKRGGKEMAQNVITVSGHSEINVKPDTTKFIISVTEEGKDIKSSQQAATNKINSAIAILKQNGVLDKNIKTLNYNTYPKYSTRTASCGITTPASAPASASMSSPTGVKGKTVAVANTSSVKSPTKAPGKVVTSSAVAPMLPSTSSCTDRTSQIIGYETSQSIEVKVTEINRNPDLAGALIAAVGAVGVDVSGLTSYVDNLDMIKQNIRAQAIQKAKIQAKDIVEALGVRLGKVTAFSENSGGGYPFPMMMSAKAIGSTESAGFTAPNLPVGENLVTSDVSVSYSIK